MPEPIQELINQGLEELRQENWSAALTYFQEAIEKSPNCAEAYYNLGKAYAKLGRCEDAIEAFSHAIRIKPDYAILVRPEIDKRLSRVALKLAKELSIQMQFPKLKT
ncbi:MAG: tetratricopeptide repeat protein [Sedimentisphaerales bacterium]